MTWTPREIRRRRTAKGWNQHDLAQAIGVSRRAITNWETGKARPAGANLEALDTALGDAPLPEPTLRSAGDGELLAELARRLEERVKLARRLTELGQASAPEAPLPSADLAWPARARRVRKDVPR